MSTQSFPSIETQNQNLSTTKDTKEHEESLQFEDQEESYADMKFFLDEPWRVSEAGAGEASGGSIAEAGAVQSQAAAVEARRRDAAEREAIST